MTRSLLESYHDETRRAVLQQLMTYHRNPLFEDQGTPLRDFLIPGRMSVIVMNKMSDELRLIVVSALMWRLIASRVQASEAEKHLKIIEKLTPAERAGIGRGLEDSGTADVGGH